MGKYLLIAFFLCACDLRQTIVDAPSDIGGFIASRYPALLADPDTEIYEYASVLDYGSGNNASMYGFPPAESASIGDYVSYADSGDYVMPAQTTLQTISDVSKNYGALVVEEKKSFVLNTAEIKVEKGDTAYSIAKKYNMPIQRLGVLNNLEDPYPLKIGQTLKVENAEIITTKTEITKTAAAQVAPKIQEQPVVKSNIAVKLPKLDARSGSKFSWPVKGNIISDFGLKRSGLRNDGLNIGAPLGTDVVAAENGVVAYAGNELKGMGNLLIIQHAGGWMTIYAHLDDFIVTRGDKVKVGQKIGSVGRTGKVSEPQLHFEIRKGAKAFDPKKELK
jgi:hypothetical protein